MRLLCMSEIGWKLDLVVTEGEEGVTEVAEGVAFGSETLGGLLLQTLDQLHGLLEHASKRVAHQHADVVR